MNEKLIEEIQKAQVQEVQLLNKTLEGWLADKDADVFDLDGSFIHMVYAGVMSLEVMRRFLEQTELDAATEDAMYKFLEKHGFQ